MKKHKLIIPLLVGIIYALLTMIVLTLLVGAVMFCKAIVTDMMPTTLERIGIIFVMVVGGAIAALVAYKDEDGGNCVK